MKEYKLKIDFQAEEKDGEALLAALVQICEAWRRHERITAVGYERPDVALGSTMNSTSER